VNAIEGSKISPNLLEGAYRKGSVRGGARSMTGLDGNVNRQLLCALSSAKIPT
jgi:hypothetical protein